MPSVCPVCATPQPAHSMAVNAYSEKLFCCTACNHQWTAEDNSQIEEKTHLSPLKTDLTAKAVSRRAKPASSRMADEAGAATKAASAQASRGLWRNITSTSATWAIVIVILGSVPLAVSKRDSLVRHLPQLAPAFKLIGLPVNLRGLTFAELKTRILEDNGQKILTIEGTIASVASVKTSVPPVLISLRGNDGREIYHWTARVGQSQIEPGKSLSFRTRLASPPDTAQIVQVNFTNAESSILR